MLDRHVSGGPGVPGGPGAHGPGAPSSDPLVGRVLDGRYRIGARIARGGMAVVYEAVDLRLDRTVAVKVMHAGLGDDEEFAARFVREARAAARLSHPHVVAVHDQGTDDGVVFLVMEYVAGHTLRDVVRTESPMPPARALALLEPVVSALAAAHRSGLVHRDVKPENVLIADDGRVKVADFGLAKAVSAETQHTATGILIGTVSYLAPELVTEGRADARADVYAVGVMLYELLTGTKPHTGETPIQVAYSHVHTDVPPPSRAVGRARAGGPGVGPGVGIPAYVDALVARATARDRGLRPADAGVLLHQVHRVQHALAAGVPEDAELTADLTPHQVVRDPGPSPAWDPARTTPEPWDAAELEALMGATATTALPLAPRLAPRLAPLARPTGPPPGSPGLTHDGGAPAPRRTRGGRGRRSRRGLVLLVVALLLAGGVGGGAWWFGWARYTTTPGVLGLSSTAAKARLDAVGLTWEVDGTAYSDTVPAGEVISTTPAPGDRVLHGGSVEAVVSRGVELHKLPDLGGLDSAAATAALGKIKAEPGRVVKHWSESVPAGEVVRTVPAAGANLRPGADVELVLSRGRRPIAVGSWVGKDADHAEHVLTGRGLVVEDSQPAYSDTVPAGHVVSQIPDEGTLFRGGTVTFVVSLGPQLVEMPAVRGHGVDSATAELEHLGLKVRIAHTAGYLGLGFVFSTDPAAGTMVREGSVVVLYLV